MPRAVIIPGSLPKVNNLPCKDDAYLGAASHDPSRAERSEGDSWAAVGHCCLWCLGCTWIWWVSVDRCTLGDSRCHRCRMFCPTQEAVL